MIIACATFLPTLFAMKRSSLMAVTFAVLCAACVIGCVKQADNAPADKPKVAATRVDEPPKAAPPAKPINPMDKQWAEWVAQSPMRQKMRAMWFACGLVVGNSLDRDIADLALLKLSADDIAAKAGGFAHHWEKVRTLNRQAAAAVGKVDWEEVSLKLNETEMACEGCHFENWSLATRGVLPETLSGWVENDTVFGDEPWGQMNLNGAPAWIAQMLQMRFQVRSAMAFARRLDKNRVLGSTRKIHEFADDQARRWRTIEAQANAISRAAQTGATWEVEGHYITLRRNCIDCHDKFAPDRGLAPTPWK
jgi:cytochrome c556